MRYAAYLDPDFIPRSLIDALVDWKDPAELDKVANSLSRLSLIQVVTYEMQEPGLQVHRAVQASCEAYQGWTAAVGKPGMVDVLSKIVEALSHLMPWVSNNPDDRWNAAKLFAPHATRVLSHLARAAKRPKSMHMAWLLSAMGNYERYVQFNFSESL